MRLNPGESATFEVTITNKNAPAGEWRFGSLTWKGSGYEVRSPIAVNGALFDAPAEVAGTGAAGAPASMCSSATPAATRLARTVLSADAPTSNSIGQDPDQTYPSGDDSPVGVQK